MRMRFLLFYMPEGFPFLLSRALPLTRLGIGGLWKGLPPPIIPWRWAIPTSPRYGMGFVWQEEQTSRLRPTTATNFVQAITVIENWVLSMRGSLSFLKGIFALSIP